MASVKTPLERAKERLLVELRQEIKDERVLEAIAQVPRERFVPREYQHAAYDNRPLPIGHNQTISQPLMVASMTAALGLKGDEKVLEVGTGSGYQAAVLSKLTREVITVERIAALADRADRVLRDLGYDNVRVYHTFGGLMGWPPEAPYDAIIVTAGAPRVPEELLEQLADGGRMVIPVGTREMQDLMLVIRDGTSFHTKNLGPCRFVPLVGRSAWPEKDAYS